MRAPKFNRHFDPAYGEAVDVCAGLRRLTANNPSPFTFHGTNGYLVGHDRLTVIDPGPDSDAHFEILMRAIGDRQVDYIAVTHTHLDHTPMAHRLKAVTGAPIAAFGPHQASRPLHAGEINGFAESSDLDLVPDIVLADGVGLETGGMAIEAVHTPGHTANHLAFAVRGTDFLLSGDHIMAWSTTMVAPPDGSMGDYMSSLDRLLKRRETTYLPGHGGPVADASHFVRGIRSHRRMRERAIVNRLEQGDRTIAEMVAVIYRTTDVKLHGAAAYSLLAHLEDLVERGKVITDGPPLLGGVYRPA